VLTLLLQICFHQMFLTLLLSRNDLWIKTEGRKIWYCACIHAMGFGFGFCLFVICFCKISNIKYNLTPWGLISSKEYL
jgi:hypothetical protein